MSSEKERLEEEQGKETAVENAESPQEKGENPSLPPTNDKNEPPTVKKKSRKKLWNALAAIGIAAVSFFVGVGVAPFFMDEEMLALMRIKQKIQDVYYEDIDDDRFYATLFDAINQDLLDPYSAYMTKEEYYANQIQATGQRAGTGITYATDESGVEVYVGDVRGNSPADLAGLQSGDRIVEYGNATSAMTAVSHVDTLQTFVSAQADDVPFYFTYERGGSRQTVTLCNSEFMENYVFYRTGDLSYAFTGDDALTLTQRENPIAGLPQDTAYIRLTRFYGNAGEQFAEAMNLFKQAGKKNLVLDLRANGGGYMDVLTKIGGYFCKGTTISPTIAYAEDKNGKKEYFGTKVGLYEQYFAEDSQIYVLADDGSASASECLIGCMVDYGALPLENICLTKKGDTAKTYGKGIMQTTYAFWLGYTDGIRLTTAKVKWPKSGRCIHGVGLTPADGCKTADYAFGHDAELLGGLNALGIL